MVPGRREMHMEQIINGIYLSGSVREDRAVYMLSGHPESYEHTITVSGMDWNRDLSPWPARAAFPGSEDFAGGAQAYLTRLLQAMEKFERAAGHTPRIRCLAGYSLAGLFCLYAACESDVFDGVASVSGSLWYDGFVDYMRAKPIRARRVYLSLGDRESRARDPRIARVGECTRIAEEILRRQHVDVCLIWNPGNHFQDISGRMERAVGFLQGNGPDMG